MTEKEEVIQRGRGKDYKRTNGLASAGTQHRQVEGHGVMTVKVRVCALESLQAQFLSHRLVGKIDAFFIPS